MKTFWCISSILLFFLHVQSLWFVTNGKIETIGYGFIGGTLDMTCNITNPSIKKNASDIIFTWNDKELNNTLILGEKSKKLVLELIGPQMNTAHIYCQVNNPNFTRIDSKIINVEYAPQNVTKFSCANHEWGKSLNCSWSHPVTYLNQNNIQVTSRWKSQYIEYANCSESNYNYCNLNQESYFSNKLMTIYVEVKNTKLNVSTIETFEFKSDDYVKPPPLENVTFEILDSTCIGLKWKNIRPQRTKNVIVTYESEWQDPKESVSYLVKETDDYVNRTLCGLTPYTKYSFSFTVYPDFGGYASETISINTDKTQSSVPLHSPKTTGGALYYKTLECQQGTLRNVTIYWKPLVEKNWFGIPYGTLIQYSKTGGFETTNASISWNTSSYTMQLDCSDSYDINITSVNNAGLSFPPSFLHVQKYAADFQPPKVKVEVPKEGNTSLVYVSWNVASELDHSEVEATVFWCKKSVGSVCEGQVYWKECPSNCLVSTAEIRPDQYTFGVSLENTVDRRSTGLQWEECIYIKDKKPEMSSKLSLITTSEDNTLSLRWARLTCQFGSPFIIKYTVYYCIVQEKNCKDSINSKDMQPEEEFLKLNKLQAEQEYGFWLTASSEWGEGPPSERVYGTPVDNNLNVGEIIGIVIGSLFVLVLAMAGLVFTLRHCKRKTMKVPLIDVPDTSHIYTGLIKDSTDAVYDNEKEDTIDSLNNGFSDKSNHQCMRQLSKDSGFGEEHNKRNSEEEEVGKEKELSTKKNTLPQDYVRAEGIDHIGLSPIPVSTVVNTVGFVNSMVQCPQNSEPFETSQKVLKNNTIKSEDSEQNNQQLLKVNDKSITSKPVSSYVKCYPDPNNQHQVKAHNNITGVLTKDPLAESGVNESLQGYSDNKSSSEKYGLVQVDLHPQSTLADSSDQGQENFTNIAMVTEPEQAAGNSMAHSDASNCSTGIITPETGSEGQSAVSDYVTTVSQPQQMCAEKSNNVQRSVSGYISNVISSFPLSCNNSPTSPTTGTCSQQISTSRNTPRQLSDTGYVTSVPSPCMSSANNESLNAWSTSTDSDHNNHTTLFNDVHNGINAEPAELNDEYQDTQSNYLRDTEIMHQSDLSY